MMENLRQTIKDIDDTIGRDRQSFNNEPANLYGDTAFQIETQEPAKFISHRGRVETKVNKAVFMGAFVVVTVALFAGFLLSGLLSGQSKVAEASSPEVLGVHENLYPSK